MTDSGAKMKKILLGAITGAHGIRGEVVVRTFTGQPEDIAAYGPLSDAAGTQSLIVKVVRVTPKGVIARIAGIDDRNGAEALKGTELYVDRKRLPKTAEAEYYHADLIGLEARDASGTRIGEVINVANYGAGDLIEVRRPGVKETDLIPFTGACVPEVDVAGGYLVVVPPVLTGDEEPAGGEDGAGEDA